MGRARCDVAGDEKKDGSVTGGYETGVTGRLGKPQTATTVVIWLAACCVKLSGLTG